MNIKKHISVLFLTTLILLSSTNAHAFVTFDATKGIGKIFVSISKFAGDVQDKIEDFQNKIKGLKMVQDGDNAIKSIKKTYQANKEMYLEYKDVYEDHMDTDAARIAQLTIEINKLNAAILTLEAQRTSLDHTMTKSTTTRTEYYETQIAIIRENSAFYEGKGDEESLAALASNDERIKSLEQSMDAELSDLTKTRNDELNPLDKEIANLTRERDRAKEELAQLTKSIAMDFVSDTVALTKAKDLNFVKNNKIVTAEDIKKIRENRAKERNKIIKETYVNLIAKKAYLSPKVSERQALNNNADSLEQISANIALLAENKVKDIEDLIDYAEIMVYDLKLQTAIDIANLKDFQIQTPKEAKKEDVFNLNDYEFDYQAYKDAKLAKRKLSLKDLKQNIQDVKNIGKNLHEEFAGGGFVDEWKDLGEDIVSFDKNKQKFESSGSYKIDNNLEKTVNKTKRQKNSIKNQFENMVDEANSVANDW